MERFSYAELAGLEWPQEAAGEREYLRELQASVAERERRSPGFGRWVAGLVMNGSAGGICALDGAGIGKARLEALGRGGRPLSDAEREVQGFLAAMRTVLGRHAGLAVSPETILDLHRTMEEAAHPEEAGRFRREDMSLAEVWPDCRQMRGLGPAPAPGEVPERVGAMCQALEKALADGNIDGIALAAAFAVDFLGTAPFARGNGRASVLLAALVLSKAGFSPALAVFLSHAVPSVKEMYFAGLAASCRLWRREPDGILPFAAAMLAAVALALSSYSYLGETMEGSPGPVKERLQADAVERGDPEASVLAFVRRAKGSFSSAEVLAAYPKLEIGAVRAVLRKLKEKGLVVRHGAGRASRWEAVPKG